MYKLWEIYSGEKSRPRVVIIIIRKIFSDTHGQTSRTFLYTLKHASNDHIFWMDNLYWRVRLSKLFYFILLLIYLFQSSTKRRKNKKKFKKDLGAAVMLAGNASEKTTELPQLKNCPLLIGNHNRGLIKSKTHKENRKSVSDETPSSEPKPKLIKQLGDENTVLKITGNVTNKNLCRINTE